MMELLGGGEPAPEPSVLVNVIFGSIGTACMLALCCGIVLFIRQVLRDFSKRAG